MRISNFDIKNFLIAFLLVLPSYAFVPLSAYLLLIPLLIKKDTKLDFNFYIILLIILFCAINQVVNLVVVLRDFKYSSLVPYTVFMIISYLFGKNADVRVFYYVLIFISIEVFVGMMEYASEVKSFFPAVVEKITGEAPFGYKGLIYYKRVAGLSSNSSVFAYKLLIGILLLHYLKIGGRKLWFYGALFAVGLFITFTRSVILTVLLFLFLVNISQIKNFLNDLLSKKFKVLYMFFALGIFIVGYLIFSSWEDLYFQLNRGMEDADLSQRDIVLSHYYQFVQDNPYFGNGSYKLWTNINGELYHGHNSFLQTFATNGLFIGMLFIYLVFRNTNKFNYIYLIPILVLSMFQYVIFWGVSFMDLMFFYFLFTNKERLLKEKLLIEEGTEEDQDDKDIKDVEVASLGKSQTLRENIKPSQT